MRTLTLVASTLVTLWVLSASVRADARTSLDALLALPPTPGVEALLLPHVASPLVQQPFLMTVTVNFQLD